jgi:hypothetical protein
MLIASPAVRGPVEGITMAKASRQKRAPRSPKAGRPPAELIAAPRVRRREKTAHVAFMKDTTVHQAAEGPRVILGMSRPKVKKG